MRTGFTKEEDQIIRDYYPSRGKVWSGWSILVPKHSESSIAARANRLGLASHKARCAWTDEEDRILLKHVLEIKRETGRSAHAIAGRLAVLAARAKSKK